ncbi:MAG: hypothetical protein KatS3mg081_2499 [Gemmatimonadales bacterium]|nr:MAG: hypothetical protein KatS3mg081_2499 [Gemmatimonadales bacterium]
MVKCGDARALILDLLVGESRPNTRRQLLDHLGQCRACSDQLRSLQETWEALPEAGAIEPPAALREAILGYARRVRDEELVPRSPWVALRELALPVGWAAVAALAVVGLLHLRGAVAPVGTAGLAVASVILSGVLAVVAGGIIRAGTPRSVRTMLLASLGAMGGYLVLTLALPLPEAFRLCRTALFRGSAMSLGQVCLTYLVIASLYAAIPSAVGAYAWGGRQAQWRTGIGEAMVFVFLSAPVFLLQAGWDELMVTGTVFAALVAGSLLGGFSGSWLASRRLAETTSYGG